MVPFDVSLLELAKLKFELLMVEAPLMVKLVDPVKLRVELLMVIGPGARLPEVMFRVTLSRLLEFHMLNEVDALMVVLLIELELKANPEVIFNVPPVNVQL
jgi:hypothetical protein